jgi:hypothetical protein
MKRIALTAFALSTLAFTSFAFPVLNPLSWTDLALGELFSSGGEKRGKKQQPNTTGESISASAISISTLGTPLTQNFNTLSQSGTSNAWADDTTLSGWYSQFELNSTAPTTYLGVTGSSTTAGLRSLGINGAALVSDRALGSVPIDLGADTTIGTVFTALKLVNSSGSTISSLDVSYIGEQWRAAGCTGAGCSVVAQKLDFQYQVAAAGTITDANTPSTGWVDFNSLDFVSPIVGSSSASSLDGNLAANRTAKSGSVSVTVSPGQEVWIRWININDPNLDHVLAIDDVSITPQGVVVNNCDYCLLQYPSTITVQGGQTTEQIYGRIFDVGITEPAGASASVSAQVGYGPDGSDPRSSSAWTFFPAAFNTQVGNDDEYAGTIILPASATSTQYRYTYRFSLDGGTNWSYADLDGAGTNSGLTFSPASLGLLTVTPGSAPPTINSTAPTTATEDTLYTYNVTATDPDGLGLTWSLVSPTHTCGGSINAATGSFTFTPAGPVPSASCVVAVQVTDGFAPAQSTTQTNTVTIAAVNDPPAISGTAPTAATEYAVYSYNPTVNDPDGPAPTWSLDTPTHTCGGNIDSATGAFTFTPEGPTPPASCVVSIHVSDGSLSATQSTTVSIADFASSVQFSAASYSKREGSTVDVIITREGDASSAETVNYSVSGGTATGGDCGTTGVDYDTPAGTITFLADETQKTISIQLCGDKIEEVPSETFELKITSALNAGIARPTSTTVCILEALQRGMWVFGGSLVPNPVSDPSGRNALVARSYYAGISELYVSVYQGTPDPTSGRQMYADADMAALNSSAHGAGQEVWAAYGNTDWPALTSGCPGTSFPELRMAEVAAFNASRSANERFDGVMLDVESSPTTEAEFQALIAHYECMRSKLPAELKLGVAISAFWDDDLVNYSVDGLSVESVKPASSHIIDLDLDRVVVMGYRDTAGTDSCPTSDGIICLDKDEVDYASSIGKHGLVLAGLETLNPALAGLLDKESFYDEGQSSMESEASSVGQYFNASGGFAGFAIHNYGSAFLSGEDGWPAGATPGEVHVSGRVMKLRGGGIKGAYVTVSGGDLVEPKTVTTSKLGHFEISGLSAGQSYVFYVRAKKHTFAEPVRMVSLTDNISDMDFTALH